MPVQLLRTACDTVFARRRGRYRFVNLEENKVQRTWTISTPPIDFLDWAPGAVYRFELRAIDPAGNRVRARSLTCVPRGAFGAVS